MRRWLRRLRGAFGMGLTWAAAWSPIGALIGLGLGVVLGGPTLGAVVALNVTTFAVLGFFGGTIFSAVLRIGEGSSSFDELSLPRFAGWGAVGGLLLGGLAVAAGFWGPGLTVVDAVIVGVSALLGASSAAGSLALARSADNPDLLESGTVADSSPALVDSGSTARTVR